jgi:hypothetical protein
MIVIGLNKFPFWEFVVKIEINKKEFLNLSSGEVKKRGESRKN